MNAQRMLLSSDLHKRLAYRYLARANTTAQRTQCDKLRALLGCFSEMRVYQMLTADVGRSQPRLIGYRAVMQGAYSLARLYDQ